MASKGRGAIHRSASGRPNLITGQSNLKKDISDGLVLFNFKFLDVGQGQSFQDWQTNGLLAQALEVFKSYSSQKMSASFSERFKCYKAFPEKTDFKHPKHVPEDAQWASMHLQGKPCVIGHIYQNVFYVVFLDQDHRFYITDLQDR